MQTIDILREGWVDDLPFATIKPDASSSQVKKVMGENKLSITFEDNRNLLFKINDYCIVYGERYSLSALPVVTKISQFLYQYTLEMHAEGYDLSKAQFLFLGADNTLRESEFTLMGSADDFINLIISNANRVGSGWTKGQVIPSGYKNLSFSAENCYNALSKIAEEFETEFAIEGKTIHLTKRSNDTGHTYKHGRNKGLYQITRQNLNNSSIVTRLYAYGSEKNLPPAYITNGKRLRLPGGYNPCLISSLTCTLVDNGNGTQTFGFSWTAPISPNVTAIQIEYRLAGTTDPWTNNTGGYITPPTRDVTVPLGDYEFRFRTISVTCSGPNAVTAALTITAPIVTPVFVYTPLPFIERNTSIYGVIEHTEIFDDIFPRRTGTVSAVNAGDEHEFTDAAMDFDVNSFLLPGLTAKVTFNTGQLAGYTFEIESYNHSLKQFRIQKNAEERVLELPSSTLKPAIGDKYVIVDIEMPTSYVTIAENDLLAAAIARLIELSEPQLAYTLVLDPAFMRRINRTVNLGDLVWIVDAELEVQKKIRIIGFSRNIQEEFQYQLELSDTVTPGTVSRIISAQQSSDGNIRDITNQLFNNSILNNNVMGTLIFHNMPSTPTMTGFENVVIQQSDGKLYRKV
jgi:hypothetical protein